MLNAVPPLLSVNSLEVSFPSRQGMHPAVRGISFNVAAGETLALVGESGSGKSVTSLAILRLLAPNALVTGQIEFQQQDVLAMPTDALRSLRGSGIAMIFQEPMTALNPVMPIGVQVAEAVHVHQPELSRVQVRDIALHALNAVALPSATERYRDYPHQFSGGQRQRIVILAMAIANRPQLLIADEPTTALDVSVQAQILDLLASLRDKFGLAMLFISHDLAVVARVADRIAILRGGKILEQGSRDDIFLHPQHDYTKTLLAAVPTMRTRRDVPLATLAR